MTNPPVVSCAGCGAERDVASDAYCRKCGRPFLAGGTLVHQPPDASTLVDRLPGHKRSNRFVGMLTKSGLLPMLLLALLLGAFMTGDRLWFHVYSSDVAALRAEAHEQQNTESRDYIDLGNRVDAVDKNVQNALNTQVSPDSGTEQLTRDMRITNAVTVLSLVLNLGGSQSSGSAAGKACSGWLLFGTGSITDCGFQHADN